MNTYPGDFVTKVKQINSQSYLIWMRSFAGLSSLTIRSYLHHFNLRSLYLYFAISAKLYLVVYVGKFTDVHFIFNEKLLLGQFQFKLFCNPVSVPAKITWLFYHILNIILTPKSLSECHRATRLRLVALYKV